MEDQVILFSDIMEQLQEKESALQDIEARKITIINNFREYVREGDVNEE